MTWWQILLLAFAMLGLAVGLQRFFHQTQGGCSGDGVCLPVQHDKQTDSNKGA